MKMWHPIVAAALLYSPCLAAGAPIELHVLENGHTRLDHGLELYQSQLVTKIRELTTENPRPEIRIVSEKGAKYKDIAVVLAAFQKAGYGPHFGITGNAAP